MQDHPRALRNLLDEYVNIVEQQAPAGQMALFEMAKRTKGQILDDAAAKALNTETGFAEITPTAPPTTGTQLAGPQPEGIGGIGETPPRDAQNQQPEKQSPELNTKPTS